MNNQFLGLNSTQFNTLVLVLLMVIVGLLSFRYFLYVSTTNGLSFGTGFGVNILGDEKKRI